MTEYILLGINAYKELVFFESFSPFGGATGTIMEARLTQEDVDKNNDIEYVKQEYEYLWREGTQEETLDEFAEQLISGAHQNGSLFVGDDPSGRVQAERAFNKFSPETLESVEKIIGVEGEDYVALTWTSSCHIFQKPESLNTEGWHLVLEPELIKRIIATMKPEE